MKVESTIEQLLNPPIREAEKPRGFLNKEDFLLLLVTQLRFQNPLEPMKNNDFGAQLAQFSSLEQLTNLNHTMEATQLANLNLTQSITNALSASMIGKRILAENNRFIHISPAHDVFKFTLTGPANNVTVRIISAGGAVLYEKDLGAMPKGVRDFTWDGVDKNGNLVPDGQYVFQVSAVGSGGENVAGRLMTTGIVTAVRFRDGIAYLVVNDVEIPISEVKEILTAPAGNAF